MIFSSGMDDHTHSQRAVPFSWENKPGVSKVVADTEEGEGGGYKYNIELPPPPCPSDKPKKFTLLHGEPLHVPLPPGAFDQRPFRSSSKRGFKIEDDPFLMAYKECTKSNKSQRKSSSSSKSYSPIKTLLGYFSCKVSSRNVRDSSTTVRIRQPPPSDEEDSDIYKP